jgi:ubiquinol-cytochrome c reductase cytochrome b subunit
LASVEYIMRDVPWGWLIRYMHSTGASAFFVVVYLHMFRGLMYGSYRKPRELIWLFGCAYFSGTHGRSLHGLSAALGSNVFLGRPGDRQPVLRHSVHRARSGLADSWRLCGRRCDLEPVLQFPRHRGTAGACWAWSWRTCIALHEVGSNNPDGIEIKANKGPDGIPLDGIPFHPYYSVHDIFMPSACSCLCFPRSCFFAPEMGGYFLEYNNFIPADPFQTPLHIAPVWYFTPFYTLLRAVTSEMMYVLIVCVVVECRSGGGPDQDASVVQSLDRGGCAGCRCPDDGH